MLDTKVKKFIIKCDYSRRFPDPLNKYQSDESYNIEHNILLCRAIDIPSGISKDPNPRAQRTDWGIYKDIQNSLEDSEDPTFHLKNKGITILAHKVEYSEDKRVATVYLGENDGIADGAHSYEIILDSQAKSQCPENQYVKLEIITGIPNRMIVDIAGGLNTAVQVQEASLANLEGKFDWLKETIANTHYENKISFKQNEKKDFDVRDLLGFLTLFNVLHPELKDRHPKEAYVSKAKCLKLYKDNQSSYEMLKPIVKDIFYLHDYINLNIRDLYNEAQRKKGRSGKAFGMKGVFDQKKRATYKFIFMNKESKYKLFSGVLYPIYGAMRFLVEKKPGAKYYSWKLKSFKEILSFFDKIAADMLTSTYNQSLTYGRKPDAVGKDDNHWDNLYKTVAIAYLMNKK